MDGGRNEIFFGSATFKCFFKCFFVLKKNRGDVLCDHSDHESCGYNKNDKMPTQPDCCAPPPQKNILPKIVQLEPFLIVPQFEIPHTTTTRQIITVKLRNSHTGLIETEHLTFLSFSTSYWRRSHSSYPPFYRSPHCTCS